MIKKIEKILFTLFIFGISFLFVSPVFADEAKLQINSIKNGVTELQLENGKYVLNNIDDEDIIINYELKNIDNNKQYKVILITDKWSNENDYNNAIGYGLYRVQINNNETSYRIMVCDTSECEQIYDDININIDYQVPEFLNNIKVVASNIKQADELLIGEHHIEGNYIDNNGIMHSFIGNTTTYDINKKQMVTFYLKAENLIESSVYTIIDDSNKNSVKYTGKELMDGINFEYNPNLENWEDYYDGYFKLYKNRVFISYITIESSDVLCLLPTIEKDVNEFGYQFKYTNYSNKQILTYPYGNYYIFNRNYFNQTKPLDVIVTPLEQYQYQDRNYKVSINITSGNYNIYTYENSVNGLLINTGYKMTISNLELYYPKSIDDGIVYNLNICVDDLCNRENFIYNYLGNAGRLYSKIYFERGEQNLVSAAGSGGLNSSHRLYRAHNTLFSMYPQIYLSFRSEDNYNENDIYDYKLEYGKRADVASTEIIEYDEIIKTGKISGRVLNNVGAYFVVDNHNNYAYPTYKFTIYKDDEMIFSSQPTIMLNDKQVLSGARVVSKNRNMFLVASSDQFMTSYIATRNAPITLKLSGLGFDNNKNYELDVYYEFIDGNSSKTNYQEKVTFSGRELNTRTAVINCNHIIKDEYVKANIFLGGDEVGDGQVSIQFVDSRNMFNSLNKYTLDNAEDVIKHIKKMTKIEDFINNFDVANNGTIKVYDKTGETEMTDKVGTGMLTRVINEFDEEFLDLDVVVTGDISGDGNISVTDLAKIERYLAKLGDLDGVYKMAADVNGNDSVTLTDLVKISRDIARLEEIQ